MLNNSLRDDDIQTIFEKLDALESQNIDSVTVNSLIDECNNVILHAATECYLLQEKVISGTKVNTSKMCKSNKPWFNKSCHEKRKLYHRAKCYNWRVKSAESKNNMIRCSKEYKKVSNVQYNLYNKNFIKKLRNMKEKDYKSYWCLLNRTCSNQSKQNVIDNVSLEWFFRTL